MDEQLCGLPQLPVLRAVSSLHVCWLRLRCPRLRTPLSCHGQQHRGETIPVFTTVVRVLRSLHSSVYIQTVDTQYSNSAAMNFVVCFFFLFCWGYEHARVTLPINTKLRYDQSPTPGQMHPYSKGAIKTVQAQCCGGSPVHRMVARGFVARHEYLLSTWYLLCRFVWGYGEEATRTVLERDEPSLCFVFVFCIPRVLFVRAKH